MRHASAIARRIAARFVPALGQPIQCSGCQRSKVEVIHMIAGPNVYLCDRCVEQAAQQLAPHTPPRDAVRCRFCRQLRAKEEVTAVGAVTLCADCLGSMETILAEAAQPSRPVT